MDIGKKKVEALVELRAKTEKVKGDVYKCWARFPGATQRTGQGREALTHQWWPPQMQAIEIHFILSVGFQARDSDLIVILATGIA